MKKIVWVLICMPILSIADGTWTLRAPMLEANSEFAVAEIHGEIYAMGGYPASRITQRTVQIYNIENDSWRLGPSLPMPINHGTASVVEGILYLIGGATGGGSSAGGVGEQNSVYAFDPTIGKWKNKQPMPTKRSGLVSAVANGKIYVAGGRAPRAHDFAVYDPSIDKWETLPDFPSKANHMAAASFNDKVHVFGGRLLRSHKSELTAAHLIYDPDKRIWEYGPPLPRPRSGNNAILANGCLHVWGGEGSGGMFADHDIFDPVKKVWISLPDMTFPIHGVTGAAFVGGVIFAPGGGDAVGGESGTTLNQAYKPQIKCL